MWSLLLLLYIASPDLVASQGKLKLILKGGSNPCEGYIEIYHDNAWGIVGDTGWSKNNSEVVCRSIGCGKYVNSRNIPRPKDKTKVWLNEVNCSGTHDQLWNCDGPGWGSSEYTTGSLKNIKCSGNIDFSLDEFRCAGAVQYTKTTDGKTSKGYVCRDNWGQREANLLCKTLKCGNVKEIPERGMMNAKGSKGNPISVQCASTDNEEHLWQCASQNSPSRCDSTASVICSHHQHLQLRGGDNVCAGTLEEATGTDNNVVWNRVKSCKSNLTNPDVWCKQMHCGASVSHTCHTDQNVSLTCSDKVSITLKDGQMASHCYGEVHVNRSGTLWPVCGSKWNDNKENGEMVCRELGCGKMIEATTTSGGRKGILDHVKCSGSETSLWHCKAKHDNKGFSCPSIAYVVCAASPDVRLSDGLGKCAGRVEINHKGLWKRVYKSGWTDTNSNKVCDFLECGKAKKSSDKFSQGSGPFLDKSLSCNSNSKNISDCFTNSPSSTHQEAMEITCEEHKVVFLKGDRSCSGRVGIEYAGKNYWLSGSSETWSFPAASVVCRQMHCGNAINYTSAPLRTGMKNGVWHESYNCSSEAKSLTDCPKYNGTASNDSIAVVTCSGNITVNLKHQCWGMVEVCVEGKCGGVCADSWTDEKSKLLCENLGCGNNIQPVVLLKEEESGVPFRNLYTTQQTTNLNESNIVINDACVKKTVSLVCSGSLKARFQVSRSNCSGNLEMYYQDQWLPVCETALEGRNIQNTICSELRCGQALNVLDFFGPTPDKPFVSNLQCDANNQSLAACSAVSHTSSCTPGGLQCSDWRKMKLIVDEKACEGAVYVYSEGKTFAVSSEGWTDEEGQILCQDLNCGNFGSINSSKKNSKDTMWGKSFNCTQVNSPRNIWDCEHEKKPLLNKQLYVYCQGEPNVTLAHKCYGEVKINGVGVCHSNWDDKYLKIVCQDQECSNAIRSQKSTAGRGSSANHVSCDGDEAKLGQCMTTKGKCTEGLVSVYCTGCINFTTTETCGGRIEVSYGDGWKSVCPITAVTRSLTKNLLCRRLGCGNASAYTGPGLGQKVNLDTSLICTENNKDIRHCVHQKSCKLKPAEIYCDDYVVPSPPSKSYILLIVGLFIGGFCLIMVILLFLFLRGRILRNAKSRFSTRKEVPFESGDYEDVASTANEMRVFSDRGSRSETAAFTQNDARSASSLSYDDIEEGDKAAAQPLASGRLAAVANDSGADCINNNAPAQNVTYEVDDPQDGYDDIAASPETLETEVEVHSSPGNNAEAPPGAVRGEDDYLEPDQDMRVKWE
ncbi:scavenger receptor cysteine-rich type 1 protein M160 [Centroberyx affinis]|uniref:scavenger receptor cysteine-rich type 1 protein M160 n=1 Tax=Centroberyx affinis TaxID=166261 RepID=UPI003A5BCF2B